MQPQRPTKFGRIEYAVEEHQVLQSTLRRNLAPEMVSQRHGPGGQKLAYIEGWRLIGLANEVFGFNGWSHSVTQQTIDCIDQVDDKYYVGVSATVRVELKDGAFHEDIGYGVCEGMKSKALSLEKARKEAATDGLKRALKGFGNVLGNCLGNKTYLRWANKFPTPSESPPKKNETVCDVPPDVHQSRYNAMELKQRQEALKVPLAPARSEKPETPASTKPKDPVFAKEQNPVLQQEVLAATNKTPHCGQQDSENNSILKDNLAAESDPVKLERKRRQQQKKEEFLQQLKRRRSDDNVPVNPVNIKTEVRSPVPEDDTESWMRELDPDTFRLAAEVDWSDDDITVPNAAVSKQMSANKPNANSVTNKPVAQKLQMAPPTGPKSHNFRK